MAISGAITGVERYHSSSVNCGGSCAADICADFTIKRHDTKPPFKVQIEDCDGALDLSDKTLVVEINMWASGKLKTAITASDTYFRLADDIGFDQVMVGDIIIMDRTRLPEHMLVLGFDETNKLIWVQRGYNATTSSAWIKGTSLRIFRSLDATGEIETVTGDIIDITGSIQKDQLISSFVVYEWTASDTCLPGCFLLEFKLLKMAESQSLNIMSTNSIVPSFTPSTLTPEDFGCKLGGGVEWVRRFPVDKEGFIIRITESPTTEL